MALQFNCQHCNELITSKFLKVGEIAECKKCREKNTIPKSAEVMDKKATNKELESKLADYESAEEKTRQKQLSEDEEKDNQVKSKLSINKKISMDKFKMFQSIAIIYLLGVHFISMFGDSDFHTHNYANNSHTHSYADSYHTHSYADSYHSHDTGFNSYAEEDHNHDFGYYSYSKKDHDHDADDIDISSYEFYGSDVQSVISSIGSEISSLKTKVRNVESSLSSHKIWAH